MTDSSLRAKRYKNILTYLDAHQMITIREAAEINGVSEATARRDLDDLNEATQVQRQHGGAVLKTDFREETLHNEKKKQNLDAKKRIANKAGEMIHDGASVLLDTGTTTYQLGKLLKNRKYLTVITNNLEIAEKIDLDVTSSLIVIGGIRRKAYSSITGAMAAEQIRSLHADIAFIGADAVDADQGVFNSNMEELETKQAAISCGQRTVLLVDHTKFAGKALVKVCDMDRFDCVITDREMPDETLERLRGKVKQLFIV